MFRHNYYFCQCTVHSELGVFNACKIKQFWLSPQPLFGRILQLIISQKSLSTEVTYLPGHLPGVATPGGGYPVDVQLMWPGGPVRSTWSSVILEEAQIKFGLYIDFKLRKSVTTLNTKKSYHRCGWSYVDEFGFQVKFDLPKTATPTSTSTKPEVVCSCRDRHLEIVYDAITPSRMTPRRNLVVWCRIARRLLWYDRCFSKPEVVMSQL